MTQTAHANEADSMLDTLIIGSGFAGIGMAVRLLQSDMKSFVILERAHEVGGTWRDNHYPGCACDVQSHLYSFSFAPNPKWTRMFAPQAEIQSYLKETAERFGVLPYVRFGQGVERAEYDEATCSWTVRASSGDVYRARTVVSGFGALSRPAYPSVPGLERFAGKTFHSATWDHDYDLRGKRVAVIGTGASAIQFVPQIAPQVAKLHVFQRTAPWVMHKPDRAITAFERFLFKHVPFTQVLFRATIYFLLELRVLGFKDANAMRIVQNLARRHIAKHIRDRGLRKKLTPTYTLGCKRILLSNDWYPALARENVEVVSDAIAEVREHSVVCADGSEREVDAIIYGTGFKVQEGVPQQLVFGTGGRDLAEVWSEGLRAYKGTTVAGFPNYFQLAGPNTGLGHSSMVYMIESQIAYTLDALKRMRKEGWASVEVKPEAQEAYCDRVQVGSSGSAWLSGCQSWYLDKHGRNTAIWPGFTFAFRREVRRFDAHAYITTGALRWTAAGKTKSPQSLEQAPASAAH